MYLVPAHGIIFYLPDEGFSGWPMVSRGIPLHGTSSSRETPRGNNSFLTADCSNKKTRCFVAVWPQHCGKSSVVNDAVQRQLHVSLAVSSSKIRCNKAIVDSVCMIGLFLIRMIRGSHFNAAFGGMALATLGMA